MQQFSNSQAEVLVVIKNNLGGLEIQGLCTHARSERKQMFLPIMTGGSEGTTSVL